MNKTLILVVEDDRPIRNLIVTTLKTHDYKYLAAENGSSAILEASSHHPDIVLLDLGLPDMEGVEVIKKIRTWSNMPIIVISARSEDTDKIEALDAGADDYITKPFSVEELLARIRVAQRRLAITQPGEHRPQICWVINVCVNTFPALRDKRQSSLYSIGVRCNSSPFRYAQPAE